MYYSTANTIETHAILFSNSTHWPDEKDYEIIVIDSGAVEIVRPKA
jgi:hypothetical protein